MTHIFDLRSSTTGYAVDLSYLFLGVNGLPLAQDAYLPEESISERVSWLVHATDANGWPLYDARGNPIYIREYHTFYAFHGQNNFGVVPFNADRPDLAPILDGQPGSLWSSTGAFTVAGSTGASGGEGYLRFFGLATPARHFSPGLRDWGADGPPPDAFRDIAQAIEENYIVTLDAYAARSLSSISRIVAEGVTNTGLLRTVYTPAEVSGLTVGDMVHLNRTESYPDPPNPYYATARMLHDAFLGQDVRIDLTGHVDQVSAMWGFAARNLEIHAHDGDDNIDLHWLAADGLPISARNVPQTLLVDGGAGNDVINVLHDGTVTLQGGGGDDAISLYSGGAFDPDRGTSLLSGGAGQDTIYGAVFGRNRLEGGAGDDAIYGGAAGDTIHGGDGHDLITSSAFVDPELRYGTNDLEADVIYGGSGNDTITGSQHGDVIHGGDGNDYIYGDAQGGAGNDMLFGGAGHDTYGFEAHSTYQGVTYSHGFGHDIIHDTGGTLEFSTLYETQRGSTANVAFTRLGNDLRIAFPMLDNTITLRGFYLNPQNWNVTGYDGRPAPFSLAGALSLVLPQIPGTAGRDLLNGTATANEIMGLAGNDVLIGGGGLDSLSGGAGDDVLVAGTGGVAANDTDSAIYRMYRATLDRSPDQAGHAGWNAALQQGAMSLPQISAAFVGSPEFQLTYGALDNSNFVALLYRNVLGREGLDGHAAGWVDLLNAGTSRAEVVVGFSESTEFRLQTDLAAAAWRDAGKTSDWADDVYRLYVATLGREADGAGLADWAGQLARGADFTQVVAGFTGSPEFQTRYGSLTDADFVTLLYHNVLNRAPDSAGLADWVGQLAAGTRRETVVTGFSQSAELIQRSSSAFLDHMRQLDGAMLDGGAGDDLLIGGALSDQFIFRAGEPGHDRVRGLDVWDSARFEGFGYSSAADVLGHMTQIGLDVVFVDQGLRITFEDTLLADAARIEFLLA